MKLLLNEFYVKKKDILDKRRIPPPDTVLIPPIVRYSRMTDLPDSWTVDLIDLTGRCPYISICNICVHVEFPSFCPGKITVINQRTCPDITVKIVTNL